MQEHGADVQRNAQCQQQARSDVSLEPDVVPERVARMGAMENQPNTSMTRSIISTPDNSTIAVVQYKPS